MTLPCLPGRFGIVALSVITAAYASVPAIASPLPSGGEQAVTKGLAYLRKAQMADGSWSHYPAITALSVSSFLLNGRTEKNEPAVAKALKFIVSQVKPNGSISIPGDPAKAMPSYNTSLCMQALVLTKNPAYRTIIDNGKKYLEANQFAEAKGIKRDNPMYGGIGYGDDPGDETHPDLSNLSTAIDALVVCGTKPSEPVLQKALVYLRRVQNRKQNNDQAWVKNGPNDGGFLYESQGGTKTDRGHYESYGAVTYGGLRCLLACGVPKTDPGVQAAWNWIQTHHTFAEHPNMGTASMYYYYRTAALSLDAFGKKVIVDKAGKSHSWPQELTARIVSLQRPDGSWASKNSRYWENRPDLVTNYSLIALAYCRKNAS